MDAGHLIQNMIPVIKWLGCISFGLLILFVSTYALHVLLGDGVPVMRGWKAPKAVPADPLQKGADGTYRVRLDDGSYVYVSQSELYPNDLNGVTKNA